MPGCSIGYNYVSWYKYLIVSLVFSHLGFWSGNLFLIAPFPDLCLLVPFYWRPYMASQVHINSLNLGLNFKPWFENFKPGFENFKPGFKT